MNITIKGKVVQGEQRGTSLGFPTANIPMDPIINIPEGVYAVIVLYEGYKYRGMANIGYHPTVGRSSQLLLETHLFDFNDSLYGKEIEVTLIERIRNEEHFESSEALLQALRQDRATVENIL